MIPKGLVIYWFGIMRWYGAHLGLGKTNFVLRFFVMMFSLAPPYNRTSSMMFFPTYTWITTIWLSIFIIIMSTSKCVSITVATLGVGIILVVILGFFGLVFATYIS